MPAGPILGLDDDELSTCVSCGLCLPHCPTFRVTGEERYSPRGRIEAMRAVEWRGARVDDEFVDFMETCVQCRGCEPACPSSVPFGHLIERTRTVMTARGLAAPWWLRHGLRVLRHPRLLGAGSRVLAVAQRLGVLPRRLGLPAVPLRPGPPLAATGDDVWLFTGCVMDAWMRDTHRATAALISAAGSGYDVVRRGVCCGALHLHAGLHDEAARCASETISAHPGDRPVLVNSAGCGAAMKEYGHLLGTEQAERFSSRVLDVHEWLARQMLDGNLGDLQLRSSHERAAVIVQDPCHLRHVQGAQLPVRRLLDLVADVIELDDDGLCCGAGGAYSATQPALAGDIRERKVAAIERATARSGATLVASANPGCLMYLAAAGVDVRHPVDIVAEATGLAPARGIP
ncbi:heterodisulfide reductase-related iron-sulfur binding cluster [soil metagenome]